MKIEGAWVSMEKHQLAFAVGPIVAALAVGGLLYMAYPNSFGLYSGTSEATSSTYTANIDDQASTGMAQNSPAVQTNNTANQDATAATQGNMSSTIPSPEPSQPSNNNGY